MTTTTTIDVDRMAEILSSMANPVRLRILQTLAEPKQLKDIRVRPARQEAGAVPERPMSRSSVREHLDKLVDLGVVRKESHMDGRRSRELYAINHSRLYMLAEEMRRVSLMNSNTTTADATEVLGSPKDRGSLRGVELVLVNGVQEGRRYPLGTPDASGRAWSIGRDAQASVSLPYDPFVSLYNARIEIRGEEFWLLADDSRNGTHLNWNPLADGDAQPIESGDVIGVGRSLLVFRTD